MVAETYAVPQPVGCGRESDTARADGKREDLAYDDPRARAPGRGEEEDVDADERDHRADGLVVLTIGYADDGDNELADEHSESAPDEQRTTTELLNGPEGDRGRADVDEGRDERDEERVGDGSERLEECGAKIEDEVDAGPLLHHLQRRAKDGAADVAVRLPEAAAEAVEPGVEVVALRDHLELVLVVGNDLGKLLLDVFRVDGLTSEPGEHGGGVVELATLDKVSRRLGEEEETGAEDDGPRHLDGDRDAVRARVQAVLRAIVDARGEQETDRDAELVARDEGAAHLSRRDLGHVQDDDGRDEADAEACDETARHEEFVGGRGGLKNDTDDEDEAAHDDGGATAGEIGKIASDERAEEGSSGENGHNQGLLPRGNGPEGCVGRVAVRQPGVCVDDIVHTKDTVDVARVISEENTTKGGKGAHEVGLERDRRLDAIHVGGRGERNSTARHDGQLDFPKRWYYRF